MLDNRVTQTFKRGRQWGESSEASRGGNSGGRNETETRKISLGGKTSKNGDANGSLSCVEKKEKKSAMAWRRYSLKRREKERLKFQCT